MMREAWRRIRNDLRHRRFIDAYGIALVAFVLAVLSLVPDIVPDPLRWAALLGGVGMLVLRVTIPDATTANIDDLLSDRFIFDKVPFAERIANAAEVWIFAPTAINILSAHNCELFRAKVLRRPNGVIRVVVLDPANRPAVELAIRQLDDSLDYPVQDFRDSLEATERQLRAMSSWQVAGSFKYRFLDYNPGFSLVAIDPSTRQGRIIVEFHAFHNEATSSRMHIEISRQQSERWYTYWSEQFSRIWSSAATPTGGESASSLSAD